MKPHLLFYTGLAAASTHWQDRRQTGPAIACASLQPPTIPSARVISLQAAERRNFTAPRGGGGGGPPGAGAGAAPLPALNFCDVNVTLTHGNDSVRIEVWLPLLPGAWNGRFQGTGGGGFIPGTFGGALAPQVAAGFAAASTDAGLRPASFDGSGIAFTNQTRINFAFLSVHEMALVGKAVAAQFYGVAPRFSYWNGCSTGGRQGYMEAQSFPEDFDGILAAAPAINWDKFCPAEFWPFQVQSEAGQFVPQCVFTALTRANVRACDGLDGAMDGLIGDPSVCRFDANSVVGMPVQCNNTTMSISPSQATIYNRILGGPKDINGTQLWFGVEPGTDLTFLDGTTPFNLGATWLDTFVSSTSQLGGRLSRNNTVSAQEYINLFKASISSQFGLLLATDNADLSRLRASGSKLLSWHGLADPIIMPQGTFDYRRRVEALMGGATAVDEFYRLFTAPGVGHCGGGGPSPNNSAALEVLINWVENGVAPETLPANSVVNGVTVSRNLCRFPLVAHFSGNGNVNSSAGWTCVQPGQNVAFVETSGAGVLSTALSWCASTVLALAWMVM